MITIIATSDEVYRDFLSNLKQAALLLDTFAQVQACAGGLNMSNRATTTFEVVASLENYIKDIERNEREKAPMLLGMDG